MVWKGFKDTQATIEISLIKSEEELWEKVDKDGRWGVKKAEREKLIIKENFSEKDLNGFFKIYKETCLYGGINPHSEEEIKKEKPKFFLCYKDNQVIAGSAVILNSKEKFTLFLNASSPDYQKYQPNNLLYWHCIIWGKKNGYKIFDLGGFQLGAKPGEKLCNINRFKERWGGEKKIYYIYSKNPIYIIGRKLIKKSGFFKKIWDKIKGRPTQKSRINKRGKNV
jgi:lipid II:glycine glycyltransferase (peptidoglycan interpeptide bridge formation enzyme)